MRHYIFSMAEIEIKARVSNRDAVIEVLNNKATFVQAVVRDDEYWANTRSGKPKIRIRKELCNGKTEFFLTYKKKERHSEENGSIIEVNDEQETSILDPAPLISFLKDSNCSLQLKKHKEVMDWSLPVKDIPEAPDLTATFELCKIPPLGDFLEIEIISPSAEPDLVKKIHAKLEELLLLAGLNSSDIEPRYYSQLLKEAGAAL